ncbi:mtDNA inheritance protein [Komagataella phaffii CBS 7435]|uniref:Protein DML1 n=2 Tax=Komagataella phaffii TaxID=460519 RepID=C4QVG5_KOMPG|nr:Essential protein involved in mtDNA inheritance [Komagataella phaffii GS115]AOA61427.1 GQ67_02430T0 [Komagataella phaffii]CAH2445894.1 mtDNA inheritance protein [Komagataella phaffii CBS 7435]AOA66876.1 GQ68_02817T0 [Komagataella phaffii GS115]CAY67238.1 Essential protein involved in mtDNA inheritance [Komagataella phaffii GS115]CCA36343.1 mtDNA inheritance protein [Komagataella phaffii CBS 7435]
MQEIFTIGLSNHANHVVTHFFNEQESHFDYTGIGKSDLEPEVFFREVKTGNYVSLTPRALLWDLHGGIGKLPGSQRVSAESPADPDFSLDSDFKVEKIVQPPIPESNYQKTLDENKPVFSVDDTKFWSSYSTMIFDETRIKCLEKWENDSGNGHLRSAESVKFDDFTVGADVWKDEGQSFIDNSFRKELEQSDLLDGINLIVDIDSAWAGFGSQMLQDIREELPKKTILGYGLFQKEVNLKRTISRIHGFLGMVDNCSLVVPLFQTSESLYESSAVESVVVSSINGLFNSKAQDQVSMTQFVDSIRLNSNRNIIGDVFWDDKLLSGPLCPGKINNRNQYVYSRSVIHRGKGPTNKFYSNFDYLKSQGTSSRGMNQYNVSPLGQPQTFPQIVDNDVYVKLDINTKPRQDLLNMKDIVKRYVSYDEREELVDHLLSLAEEYEYGFIDED